MTLIWPFVGNVVAHWLSLLTGGIIAFAMLFYERYSKKSISWRRFRAIMALAVSLSCFQAWSDVHRNSEVLKLEKAALTSQLAHSQASLEYEQH
jgi:glucose-6-phosphate-specific signal transduction histidine kinase